jgi:UDP-N-acetylglucosamine 3-dehydrogenase
MKKLNIGMVGLGRIASSTHIPILKTLDYVEVAAGAETNPERAQRVKSLFGLPKVYEDYEKMYESEKLDAVYICLPSFLHKDSCKKALEHGLHVLCEKPMCMSVKEAEEVNMVAKDRHLLLMPGYKRRYTKKFLKARTIIESGLLGKIIQVQGTCLTPGPYISWDPKSDWYLDKNWHGVIYDIGCHLVDLILFLVPSKISKVKVLTQKGYTGYDTPTNVSSIFEMEGGATGNLSISWRAAIDMISISLHGTAGSLIVSNDYFAYLNPGTDPLDKIQIDFKNAYSNSTTLARQIRDKVKGSTFSPEDFEQTVQFCRSIYGLQTPPVDGNDAIRVHQFLEQMIVSSTS